MAMEVSLFGVVWGPQDLGSTLCVECFLLPNLIFTTTLRGIRNISIHILQVARLRCRDVK